MGWDGCTLWTTRNNCVEGNKQEYGGNEAKFAGAGGDHVWAVFDNKGSDEYANMLCVFLLREIPNEYYVYKFITADECGLVHAGRAEQARLPSDFVALAKDPSTEGHEYFL